jgi:hypothetical protein
MTGLPPEVAVLVIAFGLVLALGCYLVTNLSPGGMITPGWLALALIVEPRLAVVIGVVVVVTYFLCEALQRVVILYGKRLFATVVLVAVFFQLTAFMLFVRTAALYDVTTLGFIVPGLVAYQLIRQPAFATITATATVTMVAYCVTLGGVLLRLIPTEERVAANGIAATPSEAFSSLQLALAAAGFVVVLAVIAVQMRRVRGAPEAEPALDIGGEVARGRPVPGLGWVANMGRTLAGLGRAVVSLARAAAAFVPARRTMHPAAAPIELSPVPTAPAKLVLVAPREFRTATRGVATQGFVARQRSRETVFVLAGIAAAFAIHFGFGGPDENKSIKREVHSPRAAAGGAAVTAGVFERAASPSRVRLSRGRVKANARAPGALRRRGRPPGPW